MRTYFFCNKRIESIVSSSESIMRGYLARKELNCIVKSSIRAESYNFDFALSAFASSTSAWNF
jgi:hypothetical protein